MSDAAPLRFGKGIRLRTESDGSAMLLVPEGVLQLNGTAGAALELVDGRRTLPEIVAAVVERFDVAPEEARASVAELFERLADRGFLRDG
jgi:pyrroloquinoline quinone biosynthesis protein D